MPPSKGSALLAAGVTLCLTAVQLAHPVGLAAKPPTSPPAGQPSPVVIVMDGPCAPIAPGTFAGRVTCSDQLPVLAQLKTAKATVVSTTRLVDTITARVTPMEGEALLSLPGVSRVVTDSPVRLVRPGAPAHSRAALPRAQVSGPGSQSAAVPCGTRASPELDPEALQTINAQAAWSLGFDGAGVTVGVLYDGVDATNADLQRNPAYGVAGRRVVHQVDFSGDPAGTPDQFGESFGDVSAIAAQGNEEYDLSRYVNPSQAAHMPADGCWIRVVGAAPGANVLALKATGGNDDLTLSSFVQAIQYAVDHGAKVLNESFDSWRFPDTAADLIRQADDAAVAAGVTVVVAAGDAGSTNTIASPASDPNLISVGATTVLRWYAQMNFGGFFNPAVGNGRWIDNNIAGLSSGGFTQAGNTVNLVAPGDTDWSICSPDPVLYPGCNADVGGSDVGLTWGNGTSESAPLTAAAAADVIQAYAEAHGGADPSPALVKQILVSSASDTRSPADEQGAGLLNIGAAVKLAQSIPRHAGAIGYAAAPGGRPLIRTTQINIVGSPGASESRDISLTNTGTSAEHVELSTRALTRKVYDSGVQTFAMDPTSPTTNSGTMTDEFGVTNVYQTETFSVPRTGTGLPSRLLFSAAYPFTGQSGEVDVALFEPDGTYAAFTGIVFALGDYVDLQVNDPVPGRWTALFFTIQDGPGYSGTSGPIKWDAQTWQFAPAGSITPRTLDIPAGQTATATLTLTVPETAGDTDQSVVAASGGGQTTIPVTVRSMVSIGPKGSTFHGVLTGGQPGILAQSNTYYFDVPRGEADVEATVTLANNPSAGLISGDVLLASLVDPNGQTVGYSSDFTLRPTSGGLQPAASRFTEIYHRAPIPGRWEIVLFWTNPVVGDELSDAFTGSIAFNKVKVSSNLPDTGAVRLSTSMRFEVRVENTGVAPEGFFVDPRLDNRTENLDLINQNPAVDASSFTIPLPAGVSYPVYFVPTHTRQLKAAVSSANGATPVTFDLSSGFNDPDLSPSVPSGRVTSSFGRGSASLTLSQDPQVSPGYWLLNPGEIGPYPRSGMKPDAASASLWAVTQAFDPAVTSSTGNLWDGSLGDFLYLRPGQSGTIEVNISPTGSPGTTVSGTLFIDDVTLGGYSVASTDGDELAAVPYQYTTG